MNDLCFSRCFYSHRGNKIYTQVVVADTECKKCKCLIEAGRERKRETVALARNSRMHREGNGVEEKMVRISLVETGKATETACTNTHPKVHGTLEMMSSLLKKNHSGEDANTQVEENKNHSEFC